MKKYNIPVTLSLALLAFFSLGLLACSSDDPTAPQQTPQDPGGGGAGSAVWNITVTPEDSELLSTGGDSTTVTIQVRNASTGAPPPNGTTIAVTATNGVFPNGLDGIALELINGAASTRFTPSLPGSAVITARLEESFGQARITILDPADSVFLLSHVEPNSGTPAGGDTVTIFGQNIRQPVRVTIGGVVAQVLSVSSTRIRVVTPPSTNPPPVGQTQAVPVAVTNAVGTEFEASDSLPNGFIYAHGGGIAQPQIFSITPTTGPNEGGTEVVINGSGFQSPVQVLLGSGENELEAQVLSVQESRIRFLTPQARSFGRDLRNQQVDVTVVNLSSGFEAVAPRGFRYGTSIQITAIDPTSGERGTLVTIYGDGFQDPLIVEWNGDNQQVTSVTGSEIVVRPDAPAACSDVSSPFTVRLINIADSATTSQSFRLIVPPLQIFGVNPTSGPQGGNTLVTISGANFDSPAQVFFGGQPGTSVSVSGDGSTVTARTPAFTGNFQEVSCDENGDGQQGQRFVPASVSVTVTNLDTGCTVTLPNAFSYNPTDTSCRGDVAPVEEDPQCSNGVDDDLDGDIDFPDDAQCTSADDDNEAS